MPPKLERQQSLEQRAELQNAEIEALREIFLDDLSIEEEKRSIHAPIKFQLRVKPYMSSDADNHSSVLLNCSMVATEKRPSIVAEGDRGLTDDELVELNSRIDSEVRQLATAGEESIVHSVILMVQDYLQSHNRLSAESVMAEMLELQRQEELQRLAIEQKARDDQLRDDQRLQEELAASLERQRLDRERVHTEYIARVEEDAHVWDSDNTRSSEDELSTASLDSSDFLSPPPPTAPSTKFTTTASTNRFKPIASPQLNPARLRDIERSYVGADSSSSEDSESSEFSDISEYSTSDDDDDEESDVSNDTDDDGSEEMSLPFEFEPVAAVKSPKKTKSTTKAAGRSVQISAKPSVTAASSSRHLQLPPNQPIIRQSSSSDSSRRSLRAVAGDDSDSEELDDVSMLSFSPTNSPKLPPSSPSMQPLSVISKFPQPLLSPQPQSLGSQSRYHSDFQELSLLGQGGFGVRCLIFDLMLV